MTTQHNNNELSSEFIENGKQLYDRYCSWVDYRSFNGEKLKDFRDLPEKIKNAWIRSANNQTKTLTE